MSARTYLALFVFYAIAAFVSGVGIGLTISRLGEEAERKAE